MEALAGRKDFPIIGPLVGRFLFQLARITRAKRVFELGSGFGYSALWFAMGMPPGGKVYCTDTDPENMKLAISFFKQAKQSHKLIFQIGDAVKILSKTAGKYDLMLNDIDKKDYPKALKVALPKLKKGGILISDNLLRDGSIFTNPLDADSRGILTYTKGIYSDKALFSTIMPIRDGISLSLKIQ